MSKINWFIFVSLPLMMTANNTIQANNKVNENAGAIKKAQGLIRQLNQEKKDLETENSALQNQIAEYKTKLQAAESAANRLPGLIADIERYKAGSEAARANLDNQLGQERDRVQVLLQKLKALIAKAKAIQSDNRLLVQAVQEREHWIEQCGKLNQDMQLTNREFIDRLKDKSLWEQLADFEPVTGISKVETEEQLEAYRYQLHQLQVTPYQGSNLPEAAPANNTAPENPTADVPETNQ